jgi:predicted amidohydrolase
MIIDPAGTTVAALGDRIGTTVATVCPARLAEIRDRNPSLSLRRLV